MTELHNHLTIGFRPRGECGACDLVRRDIRRSRKALRKSGMVALSA